MIGGCCWTLKRRWNVFKQFIIPPMNNLDGVMQALLKRRHLITQTPAFPKCPICTSATPCIFYTSSSQISSQSRLSMVQSFRMSSQSLPSFFAFFYSSTSNITVINCFSMSLFVASLLSILLFFSFFPFAVIASLIISLSLSLWSALRGLFIQQQPTQSRAEQNRAVKAVWLAKMGITSETQQNSSLPYASSILPPLTCCHLNASLLFFVVLSVFVCVWGHVCTNYLIVKEQQLQWRKDNCGWTHSKKDYRINRKYINKCTEYFYIPLINIF